MVNLKTYTVSQVKLHKYLGFTIDFSMKGKVKVGMYYYVEMMIHNLPQKLKSTYTAITPASNNLF